MSHYGVMFDLEINVNQFDMYFMVPPVILTYSQDYIVLGDVEAKDQMFYAVRWRLDLVS